MKKRERERERLFRVLNVEVMEPWEWHKTTKWPPHCPLSSHSHSLPKPMSFYSYTLDPPKIFFFFKINKWQDVFLILIFLSNFIFIFSFKFINICKVSFIVMFKLNIWKKFNTREISSYLKITMIEIMNLETMISENN